MSRTLMVLMLMVMAVVFGDLITAHALTVQINGSTVPSNVATDDALTVTLSEADGTAHTYGCFKVEALDKTPAPPDNRARVRAIDDNQDTLVFDNALIKAVTANCLAEITAWHTFSAGDRLPTTHQTTGIRFKRQVAAKAYRGVNPASGDEMWTTGWVPANSTSPANPIDEIGYTYYRKFPSNDPNFNDTQQEDCVDPNCQITGQRDMKWWLKFNLKFATAPDRIELSTLKTFTENVSNTGPSRSLPEGAKIGPYESFKDDKPCEEEQPCKKPPCKKKKEEQEQRQQRSK